MIITGHRKLARHDWTKPATTPTTIIFSSKTVVNHLDTNWGTGARGSSVWFDNSLHLAFAIIFFPSPISIFKTGSF